MCVNSPQSSERCTLDQNCGKMVKWSNASIVVQIMVQDDPNQIEWLAVWFLVVKSSFCLMETSQVVKHLMHPENTKTIVQIQLDLDSLKMAKAYLIHCESHFRGLSIPTWNKQPPPPIIFFGHVSCSRSSRPTCIPWEHYIPTHVKLK